MFDQADKLRQLVRDTVKENPALAPGVPLVAISGARSGVGTSTVALRLAQELTQLGKQVVLVDANLLNPTIAEKLDFVPHAGIREVLNGTRSAAEVLEPITSGLHFLPGTHAKSNPPDMNIRALRRLLTELRTMHKYADLVLLDAGFGLCPWVERMWTAAMQILLVSTADCVAVRDGYATVKMAPWGDVDGKLRLVLNQCDDPILAGRVSDGFSSTCRRFLGMKLVGNASQIATDSRLLQDGKQTNGASHHRQTVRLLAADVLSHTFVLTQRTLGLNCSRISAKSQAAGLLVEVPASSES